MKLTTTNGGTAIAATPSDPRCAALLHRYGDTAAMMAAWAPAKAASIAAHAQQSCNAPSLVLMMRAYGSDSIALLLEAHITAALAAAGIADRFTSNDREAIARMITENERLRTLNMAYLIRFFAKFGQGEFELYGYTPFSLMRCLQTYAKDAHAEQRRMMEAAATRQEREERERHEAEVAEFKKQVIENNATDPVAEFLKSLQQ